MRAVLICHAEDDLARIGLARWLSSFCELTGMVVLREDLRHARRRVRRQLKRAGWLRLLDVFAFRVYYRLFLAAADRRREQEILADACRRHPPVPERMQTLVSDTPNTAAVEQFLRECAPDVIIARCKVILRENIFTQARCGTFVLHPGICPEYRNSHGCFWALAQGDLGNVGMTLLKIDKGVDTGPVYGYYRYPFDELAESHIMIQHRVVFENLDAIARKLCEIGSGEAIPIEIRNRVSAAWGQPWLSSYLRWKRAARQRHGTA